MDARAVDPAALRGIDLHLHERLDGASQTDARAIPLWRAVCFPAGLATIWFSIASPLDAMGNLLLQAHMTQHLLIAMVAPPLIWLSAPGIPMLRGLPNRIRKYWIGPFLAWKPLRTFFHFLTHPVTCLFLFIAVTWTWHWPPLYELGLRNASWHQFEHACFILASLLFWWPVIQPWPSKSVLPRWSMIPYLLIADISNTVFSAAFCFWEKVIYPTYENAPRIIGISAMDDQAIAGAIMWVPGSILFLIPVGMIIMEQLSPRLSLASASRPPPLRNLRKPCISPFWRLLPAGHSIPLAWMSPRARRVIRSIC